MIESKRRSSAPPDLFVKWVVDRIFKGSSVPVYVFTEIQQDMELCPQLVIQIKPRTGAYMDSSNQGALTDIVFGTSVIVNAESLKYGDPLNLAHEINEAVRIGFEMAQREQWYHPQFGSVSWYRMAQPSALENDWQTGTNTVQYASLPDGFYRFESTHRMIIRQTATGFKNRFIKRPTT